MRFDLRRDVRAAVLAAGLAASLSACSINASTSAGTAQNSTPPVDVKGTLVYESLLNMGPVSMLLSTEQLQPGHECYGAGPNSDLKEGAEVTVTDESGKVVGLGHLGKGSLTLKGSIACTFTFSVPDVGDHSFYGVQIARRDVTRYTKVQLASPLQYEVRAD